MIEVTYNKILNKFNNEKNIPFYISKNVIKYVENKNLEIPVNSDLFISLQNLIYTELYEKANIEYDESLDKFYGIAGEVIKLPSFEK